MSNEQSFWHKWPIWRIIALAAGFPFTVFLVIHFWSSWSSWTWWLMLAAFVWMWIVTAFTIIRDWRSIPHRRTDTPVSR